MVTSTPAVCAILPVCRPSLDDLTALVTLLVPQVQCLVLVDSSNDLSLHALQPLLRKLPVHILDLHQEVNTPVAQNYGIVWAKEQGVSHVLFMAPTSLPTPGMVKTLYRVDHYLREHAQAVAAVAPQSINRETGKLEPFLKYARFGKKQIWEGQHGREFTPADVLMGSGRLIHLSVFDAVGLLREELAEEEAEVEWLWRARQKGYQPYGVHSARIEQNEKSIRSFMARKIAKLS